MIFSLRKVGEARQSLTLWVTLIQPDEDLDERVAMDDLITAEHCSTGFPIKPKRNPLPPNKAVYRQMIIINKMMT